MGGVLFTGEEARALTADPDGRPDDTAVAPLLEWSDAYLIGVDSLDREHLDLFARVNELNAQLARHEDKSRIEETLGEIHSRMMAHFALEEKFMRDTDFPNYARHKREHERFLSNIVEVIEEFRKVPGLGYSESLMAELKHWIINHVLTSDQELSQDTG